MTAFRFTWLPLVRGAKAGPSTQSWLPYVRMPNCFPARCGQLSSARRCSRLVIAGPTQASQGCSTAADSPGPQPLPPGPRWRLNQQRQAVRLYESEAPAPAERAPHQPCCEVNSDAETDTAFTVRAYACLSKL